MVGMGLFSKLKAVLAGAPADPVITWVTCALSIITGDDTEPGAWPAAEARETLATWWSVGDANAAGAAIERMAAGTGAWDLLRGLHVTRMAKAAGYLGDEDARRQSIGFATRLMPAFESWQALALAYWSAQRSWAAENAVEVPDAAQRQRDLGRLHVELWAATPFRANLS
jgi:Protein of unknown function (DUF1266)